MRLHLKSLVAVVLFVVSATWSHAAPVLKVVDGRLAGADHVAVGSLFFDVEFVEGTCAEVYGSCTLAAFQPFADLDTARAAGQALLDTVLIDSALGLFDTKPELTYGCSYRGACSIFMPQTVGPTLVRGFGVNNMSPIYELNNIDGISSPQGVQAILDFDSRGADIVFARWTASAAAPIPLPATPYLVVVALASLFLVRTISRAS